MKTYRLYIGGNNKTHKVELGIVYSVLDTMYEGYTVEKALGVWKKQHEESVIVTLMSAASELQKALFRLKKQLKQEAIAVQEVAELRFV